MSGEISHLPLSFLAQTNTLRTLQQDVLMITRYRYATPTLRMTSGGKRTGRSGRRPSTPSRRSTLGGGWTSTSRRTSPSKAICFEISLQGRGTMDDVRERRRNDLLGLAFDFGFRERPRV
jgi:hypothetical protein